MQKKKDLSAASNSKSSPLMLLAIGNILFLWFVSAKFKSKSTSQLIAILVTAQCMAIPVLFSLAIGVFNMTSSTLPHQRYIPLAAVGTIAGNLLPLYLSSALANLAIVIFGLSSRPISTKRDDDVVPSQQKSDLLAGPLGTVLAAFVMTTMLLIENFCIWVVSATYKASQNMETLPAPLQDNGQIIMRYFFTSVLEVSKKQVVRIRNQIKVEWILVSGLGLALVALEMDGGRMRRSLWGVGKRALYTLGIARGIRTFSFLITVLPSQNPKCYFSHFPTPPDEWIPWIMEGFVPQANGGCNDLIVSGHATVTSTLACMVTSVVGEPYFTAAIWIFVAMDYMVEVYEGFHYTVGAYSITTFAMMLPPILDRFLTFNLWSFCCCCRHVAWSYLGQLHLEYIGFCRRFCESTTGKSAEEIIRSSSRCHNLRFCTVFCPSCWFLFTTEWDHPKRLCQLHYCRLLLRCCLPDIENWI